MVGEPHEVLKRLESGDCSVDGGNATFSRHAESALARAAGLFAFYLGGEGLPRATALPPKPRRVRAHCKPLCGAPALVRHTSWRGPPVLPLRRALPLRLSGGALEHAAAHGRSVLSADDVMDAARELGFGVRFTITFFMDLPSRSIPILLPPVDPPTRPAR